MAWKGDPHSIHDDVSEEISNLTEKASPVNADLVLIEDSEDLHSKKKAQLGNLPGGGNGGGGGSVEKIDDYLRARQDDETAHDDDDFFDSTGLSDWTSIAISGSSSFTEKYGVASGSYSGQNAGDVGGLLKSITSASAPMTIETMVRWANSNSTFHSIGLMFTDGTTDSDNAVVCRRTNESDGRVFKSAGTLTAYTGGTNTAVNTDFNLGVGLYLRLVWTAANSFAASVSIDGITWDDLGLGTWTRTMTPTHFGLFVSAQGGSETGMATFRYFRVYDSDLSV